MTSLKSATAFLMMLALPAVAIPFDIKTFVNPAQTVPRAMVCGAEEGATITSGAEADVRDFQINVSDLNFARLACSSQTVLETSKPVQFRFSAPDQTRSILVAFGPSLVSRFADVLPLTSAALGSVPGLSSQANDVNFDTLSEIDPAFSLLSAGNINLITHAAMKSSGEIQSDIVGVTPVPRSVSAPLLMAGIGGLASMRRTRT